MRRSVVDVSALVPVRVECGHAVSMDKDGVFWVELPDGWHRRLSMSGVSKLLNSCRPQTKAILDGYGGPSVVMLIGRERGRWRTTSGLLRFWVRLYEYSDGLWQRLEAIATQLSALQQERSQLLARAPRVQPPVAEN